MRWESVVKWWNTHMHTQWISHCKSYCYVLVDPEQMAGAGKWIWSGWWRGIICGIMGLYVMLYRDIACLESPDTPAWFREEIRVFVAVQKIF